MIRQHLGVTKEASVKVRQRAKCVMYTALYCDPTGQQRSAGALTSERAALRSGRRKESSVETGT